MRSITLHATWIVKAPLRDVFAIMTDFEKMPQHFPKVAESVHITRRDGNTLVMDVVARSFGARFPVTMKTQILPGKGYISDNESPRFGTSGHEELILSENDAETTIEYTYRVDLHRWWLRVLAVPLLTWYSMRYWEKAVIDELRRMVER